MAWLKAMTRSLALALALGTATGARAQPAPAQAGLVVRFGDGRVVTRCVALPEGTLTGVELLERSGLDMAIKVEGLGALVCRIDTEGCPREDCLCHCRQLGDGCRYWAYHSLEDGRWRYEQRGPTARRVVAGDVDGWAWGAGSVSAGAEPPPLTFAQICAPPSPTAVSAPSVAPPSAGPPPATAARRATSGPTASPARSQAAATTIATPTTRATATAATAAPADTPSRTPAALVADPTWAADVRARMRLATQAAYPTHLAALEATAAARTEGSAGSAAVPGPTGKNPATDAEADPPADDTPPGDASVAPTPARSATVPVLARPPAASTAPSAPPPRLPWAALGVLAILGLAWWRGRRAGA